jgi:hypothetical protein
MTQDRSSDLNESGSHEQSADVLEAVLHELQEIRAVLKTRSDEGQEYQQQQRAAKKPKLMSENDRTDNEIAVLGMELEMIHKMRMDALMKKLH